MNKLAKLMLITAVILLIASGCGQDKQAGQANKDKNQLNTAANSNSEKAETYKATLFFADQDVNKMYRVEKEITASRKEDLPKAALEAWIQGPDNDKLTSLVPVDVAVESVKINNGVAEVNFSKRLKEANVGAPGEQFILDQISLVMEQFGYKSTQILIEGKIEESLHGHMEINEPYIAPDPEKYEWLK